MDVTLNQNSIDIPPEVVTWGDLLDWLETVYLQAGQCITHVSLGGNETFNYRDTVLCDQAVAAVGRIAVECGDFDNVVRESMHELDQEVGNTLALTREIIRLLENRQEEEAYNRLAQLLDSIRIFFTVFSADLGWSEAADAEISREEFSSSLERALTQLIAAQENRMWVSICDVLEYEITPILESWQTLVERTCEHIN